MAPEMVDGEPSRPQYRRRGDGFCVAALVCVFGAAGILKLGSPMNAVGAAAAPFPDADLEFVASGVLSLATLEVLIAVGVMVPPWRALSARLGAALGAVFVAISLTQQFTTDWRECGCFGGLAALEHPLARVALGCVTVLCGRRLSRVGSAEMALNGLTAVVR